MINQHLDIQSILQKELEKQRKDRLLHVQDVRTVEHLKRVAESVSSHITVTEETVPHGDILGPQQVESLLSFVVEDSVERALTGTDLDNIVYDGLGEHRILGKHKKKKKKKKSTPYG